MRWTYWNGEKSVLQNQWISLIRDWLGFRHACPWFAEYFIWPLPMRSRPPIGSHDPRKRLPEHIDAKRNDRWSKFADNTHRFAVVYGWNNILLSSTEAPFTTQDKIMQKNSVLFFSSIKMSWTLLQLWLSWLIYLSNTNDNSHIQRNILLHIESDFPLI